MSAQPPSGEPCDPYEAWRQRAFDGMSLAEIGEFRAALRADHAAGNFHRDADRPRRKEPFSVAEVYEELRLQVRDIGKLLNDRPDGH